MSTRFSLSMEMSRLTRDGTAEPVSRDQILRHAQGQGNIIFPVQLTTSRIGNLTRLIHTLLHVMAIHTYIHTYSRTGGFTSEPLRMQLVLTAQSKHKINLLALSTEDGGPYVVVTWYVVLIVCSSCVPLNSNTNTSSHSPRRTGGGQAPASGACK